MIEGLKNEKGITILALVITIIVLLIIASISINAGSQLVEQAKIQTIETNMLAIRAKAKSYAEEIEAATWALSEGKETKRAELFGEKRNAINNNIRVWTEIGRVCEIKI